MINFRILVEKELDEVNLHYQSTYDLILLASEAMPDGLKGQYPTNEQVWWLKPLN